MTIRALPPSALALAVTLILVKPPAALAQVSVDGGYFDSGGNSSIGAALSLQLFKTPVIPLTIEATGAAPLDGHGFAATADGRFRLSGTTLGLGVGAGNLGNNTRTDIVYEGILAQSLMPHLALEARFYFGPSHPSSIFAGLRLTL